MSIHELRRWYDCGKLAVRVRSMLEDGEWERIVVMWTRVIFFDSAQVFHIGKSPHEMSRFLLLGLLSVYTRG